MKFELITPEATLFSGEAAYVLLPGSEGMFGVLPGHAPVVATLKAGLVVVELADGSKKQVVILSGLAEVTPEKAVVLAETAEDFSGADTAKAADTLQQAQQALDAAISEADKKSAHQRVAIAQTLVDGLKAA